MKLNQILMCAVAAGAMAFVSDNAQAAVIGNNLYVPLNIKATFNYVASAGTMKKATLTSKQIVAYELFPSGTQLAVGPENDIYAIDKKGLTVLVDLSTEGDFEFVTTDAIDTETVTTKGTDKYSEEGTAFLGFFSDGDSTVTSDNNYVFMLTGTYTYTDTDTADNSAAIYTETSKYSTKNLGGVGYDFDVSNSLLPTSATASGSASGKIQD